MFRKNEADELVVRQFQSETASLREGGEPWFARMAVFALAGLLICTTAITLVAKVDRVIVSSGGKVVPVQQVNVFQALDQSIIKTLDVHEGEQVKAGTQLGTLIRPSLRRMCNNCVSRLQALMRKTSATKPNCRAGR